MTGITRRIWLAAALASLALACGGEEKPTAAESAPAAAPSEPAQAEPGAAAGEMPAETMYEWDVTAGPPRDLAIDSADCQSQITGQGLAGVAQHIQCMKGKGWKTRQPAS